VFNSIPQSTMASQKEVAPSTATINNAEAPTTAPVLPPRVFLLIENPKKSNNLGAIFRCAAAFSVTQIVLVGYDKCNTEGSHGAAKHVDRIAFPALSQAVDYLRNGAKCDTFMGLLCTGAAGAYSKEGYPVKDNMEQSLVSVDALGGEQLQSDLPKSYPAHTKPFVRNEAGNNNFCIVVDKNWKGFSSLLAKMCDFFLHVPHAMVVAPDDDAMQKKEGVLLDIPSCLSISLHHLTQWANYHERVFQGHKFDVAFVQKGRLDSFQTTTKSKDSRADLKKENKIAAEDMVLGGGVFGDDDNDGDY
jgi:hypothetical protein